jgi:3-phenylpropionate/trans-cinnamate dioxygenase ferredoxin reductase subunit
MSRLRTIVVVGASLAGLRGAEALRRLGFDGRLVAVGAEPHRPYDRPPLSKDVLAGEREPDSIALRRADTWDELAVEWRLGARAVALDLAARRLRLDGGEALAFDGLFLATGASARRLRGLPALEGVHVLRTLDDALGLRAALARGPRVCIVGAGFIGAEVAATCRGLGLDVSVVEPQPAPMLRGLGAELGALMAAVHRDHGVDMRCGVGVAALEGAGRVEHVVLSDGARLAADVVVMGVGAAPEAAWLEGSGLELADGVVCDATCAAAPDVVAAGDVARWRDLRTGQTLRAEHWTNAIEQSAHAAERLLAGPGFTTPYDPVPYVWSDQFEVKLQIVGEPRPGDAMRITDGTLAERRFVAIFERDGRTTGGVGMNRARQTLALRRRIAEERAGPRPDS